MDFVFPGPVAVDGTYPLGFFLFIELCMELLSVYASQLKHIIETHPYIGAGIAFAGSFFVLRVFRLHTLRKLQAFAKKSHTNIDNIAITFFDEVRPIFYFSVSLYIASFFLILPQQVDFVLRALVLFVTLYEGIRGLQRIVDYALRQYLRRRSDAAEESGTMVTAGKIIVNTILWSIGALLLLSNLGINITSLVASLGIGGVAIALAVQTILGDIFSAFSIYFDKPFEVGDFIVIGDDSGIVGKIGLKSTRLQTLRGEELIISNKELTSTRIQNFKKLDRRREVLVLSVVYDTGMKKLRSIPDLAKQAVEKSVDAIFDRCHLNTLSDSSIDYELVYYVDSGDFVAYMDAKQTILQHLLESFREKGIDFAYPTQEVVLKK